MKDFNLHKFLRDNPLTKQKQTLKKGKINESFEGFGGYRDISPIHEAPIQTKDFNWDPTDTADYDEQSQPNKWIADIDRMQPEYGDWKATWEHPGIIVWSNADIPDAVVVATPGWDGQGTPVEFQSNAGSSQMLKVLDQDQFATFKDYLNAIRPYLDMVLDANVNPTSTDYETSDIKAPGMGEFQGLHEGKEDILNKIERWLHTTTEPYADYEFDGDDTVTLYDEDNNEIESLSVSRDMGIRSKNYMGTQYDSSEDMAVDMVKKGIRENDSFIQAQRDADSVTSDKGWQYDDEEEMPSRIEGLVNLRELAKFAEAVMAIAQDLDDEGFDSIDIKKLLKDKLDDMIIG